MRKTSWKSLQALSVGLVTIFISSHAFSISQINSEFELSLPRQFQQNIIDKKWETLMNKDFQGNWRFPDQQAVSQGVPVQLKNISLKIKTYLQKPALAPGQSLLNLTSKNLNAELRLGEVSIDHVIEREVGGVLGRFRVQAICKDVVLNLIPGKGAFSVLLAPVLGSSKAGVELRDVALSWTPGSWTSSAIHCEGAQGFDDLIQGEITKITNDSESFVAPQKELIKKYVQDSLLDQDIDFSEPRQLISVRPDLRVIMTVSEYKDLASEGSLLKGNLRIEFLQSPDQDVKTLKLNPSETVTKSSRAQLRLPQDFIKEVMRKAYSANAWLHQVSSDKIPGFSSLMSSRFSQWFVWPELMNYSKSAKFRFDVYSNKDVDIQGSGFTYQVKATFLSKMQAPKGSGYVPFMNFSLPFNSKVQLQFAGGKAQATFANPVMGLTPQWDSSYVKKYDPNQKFSSGTIRDRIVGALWGQTVSVTVPSVPVTSDISLKVQNILAPTGKDIVLQLAP